MFTSNFADSLIDKYQNYIKGDDGLLYFSFGDRGGNIFYKSSEFSQISETADEIRFQLIGHYDEAGPGGSASSSPERFSVFSRSRKSCSGVTFRSNDKISSRAGRYSTPAGSISCPK